MSDLAESDHTEMRHRSDIDGLRAVAVLAVVAFHASKRISGGFVGVDIFFVISGFLISSIILRDLKLGTFNFIDFYVRRIRRIFPALILVLLTCWVLGWYILGPKAYAYLGEHMIAGAGFVSNILLWSESGYFDPAAGSKPLLHLWSLGIEEQFYLVWPVFLVLAWKGKQKVYVWIMALLFSSFVVNIWGIYNYPIATFYLPFSRFWELLIGAMLAYVSLNHRKLLESYQVVVFKFHNRIFSLCDIASLMGILLVIAGIFLVNEASSFPGWWALLPTIGAVLLIAAGPRGFVNRTLLSNKWMISIGLISYPLYLWHWPLLSFGRMTSIGMDHPRLTTFSMVVISVLLSYGTCYLIEKPLRFGFKSQRKLVASGLLSALALLAILGGATSFKWGGWSDRYPVAVRPFLDYTFDYKDSFRNGRCLLSGAEREFASECLGTKVGSPLMLIWGDSHGAMLYRALSEASEIQGISVAQFTSSSCPPILNFEKKNRPLCQSINSNIFEQITVLHPVTVVLAHDWPQSLPENSLEGLAETVKKLRQVGVQRIILVGPAPHWGKPLHAKLVKYMLDNESSIVPSRMFDDPAAAIQILDAELRLLANSLFIEFVSTYDSFCNLEGCLTTIVSGQSNDLTAFDDAHITSAAARFLISQNGDIFFGKAK